MSFYYFFFPVLCKICLTLSFDVQLQGQSTEWTDEKHSLYLDSLEASFVNDLYRSIHLGGSCLQDNFLGTYSSREFPDKNNNSGQVRELCCFMFLLYVYVSVLIVLSIYLSSIFTYLLNHLAVHGSSRWQLEKDQL